MSSKIRLTFLEVLSFVGLPCLLYGAPMSALLPDRNVTYALPYTFSLMLAVSSFTVIFLGPRKAVMAAIFLLFLSTSVISARSDTQAAAVAAGVTSTLLPVLPFLATALILSSCCPTRLQPLALSLTFAADHGACMTYRLLDKKTLPSWTSTLDLHHCHIALTLIYLFVLLTTIFNHALSFLPSWVQERPIQESKTPEAKEAGRLERLAAFFQKKPLLQPVLVFPGVLILALNDRICVGEPLSINVWLSTVALGCAFLVVPQVTVAAATLTGLTIGIVIGNIFFSPFYSPSHSIVFLSHCLSPALIVTFWSIVPACTSPKARKAVVTTAFMTRRLFANGTMKIVLVSRADLSCMVALFAFCLLFLTLEIVFSLGFRKLEACIHGREPQLSIAADDEREMKEMHELTEVRELKGRKKEEERIDVPEKMEKKYLINIV